MCVCVWLCLCVCYVCGVFERVVFIPYKHAHTQTHTRAHLQQVSHVEVHVGAAVGCRHGQLAAARHQLHCLHLAKAHLHVHLMRQQWQ